MNTSNRVTKQLIAKQIEIKTQKTQRKQQQEQH